MEIKITRNTNPAPKPDEDNLGFGTIFTDHMFIMNYDEMEGWHDARIVPYGPITLSPAANIFHYGSGVFEGLKAHRRKDGGIQLFRPEQNAMRMFESAKRMGMPPVPKEIFIDAVRALVDIDRDWVPHSEGASLYIRPYIIGTDPTLHVDGVREELAPGTCHVCPRGSRHAIFNDGPEDLVLWTVVM